MLYTFNYEILYKPNIHVDMDIGCCNIPIMTMAIYVNLIIYYSFTDAKTSRVWGTENGTENGGRQQERIHWRPAKGIRRAFELADGLQ